MGWETLSVRDDTKDRLGEYSEDGEAWWETIERLLDEVGV